MSPAKLSSAVMRIAILAVSEATGVPEQEIINSRGAATNARRAIWRGLIRVGYTHHQVADAWGCSTNAVRAGAPAPSTYVPRSKPKMDLRPIVAPIAAAHFLSVDDLKAQDRRQTVVRARNEAFAACHAAGASTPFIGAFFDRDHSTVVYGIQRHKKLSTEKILPVGYTLSPHSQDRRSSPLLVA